ncbi:magnesium transporter [Mycoplasma sp. Mirounga ES2805-ORL]|uniref:magnesium transporter n=1 Tax=Mycoplasma sp. Mirounga ES2805-ORL TaxID=754514 RepID=UPI00197B29DC|nr:magnesium transporter [Mycoplasma sp. Mirounga ES2805-ORL]QSF13868.1 magnesium transporter [Mycoplasma sp. Mirounga ES2805-ORL]
MNEEKQKQLEELIIQIVNKKSVVEARNLIDEEPTADIAEIVDNLNLEQQLTFLRILKTSEAAELFSYLDEEVQKNLAQSFSEEWGMNLLQELQSDELADVLDELPANVTSKILAYTPIEKREKLNKVLLYNDDEVGSIMGVDISKILNTFTVEQSLHKIKRDYKKRNAELVHYYYVVDGTNKLLGVLTLEEIIFADENVTIDDIYSPVASIHSSDKKEKAAQIFTEHDMSVLPVTNDDGILVGMITSDDVIDIINDESTEDMYKMAGINLPKDNDLDYIKTPWYKFVKSRILWLITLLIFVTLTQIIIHFSLNNIVTLNSTNKSVIETYSLVIALAAVVPTITNSVSNSGTQANISISRALSLNELEKKDYTKAIVKELLVGLVLGLTLSIVNIARLSVFYASTGDLLKEFSHSKSYWVIIIATSIALFISIVIAKVLGAVIPILFANLKKDHSSISFLVLNILNSIFSTLLIFGFSYWIFNLI